MPELRTPPIEKSEEVTLDGSHGAALGIRDQIAI